MDSASAFRDHSQAMDEAAWWDLWNISYRSNDDTDLVSSELFSRAAVLINEIISGRECRVLEVACGTGLLSRMLSCCSYYGLDLSGAAISVARRKSQTTGLQIRGASPVYEVADFHEWVLPAERFDVAVCIDAISSFRDQELAMRKLAESLGIGGRLVLTTINSFVYRRIRRTNGVRLESGPVSHWLSPHELKTLVGRAGLVIERFCTIMPRGNMGILRLINSGRLNGALGPSVADWLKRAKESAGLGQYSVVVARKVQ
jgi:2-polyprenyl-3-methyl-5-hydroxy-6-metoxy-1,4-benzoquinol methylase